MVLDRLFNPSGQKPVDMVGWRRGMMGSAIFVGFALRALVIVTGAILWGDGTLCGVGFCPPTSVVVPAEIPILRKLEIAYWLK